MIRSKRRTCCAPTLLALAATLTACPSFSVRERRMRVGADPAKTRISSYLEASSMLGMTDERELVPGSISKSAVTDELVITRADADEVCVQMTQRTPTLMDEPIATWDVVFNGEDAVVDGERVTNVFDYDYTGTREVVSLEGFMQTKHSLGGIDLAISEPEARVFRVVERVAEVCGAPSADDVVRLSVRIPATRNDGPNDGWQGHYRWVLR